MEGLGSCRLPPPPKEIIINTGNQGATLPHVVSLLSWVEAQALELSYPGSHPSFLLTCCVTLGKLSKLSEPLCPTRQVGTGLMQCHRKHDDCRRWSIGSIYGVLGTY